jgi:UDP-glucose 4-epimerase
MKILITGAAGFIGSQLSYKLWKDGNSIILLDNFSYGKEDNLIFPDKNFKDEIIKADIRDKKIMEEIFQNNQIDCVFHIAGIAPLPDCQINPQEAIDVNVVGTVNILENARKYGVKKIIFASTSAIYENDNIFPSVESNFKLPTLIYPNTKYCAERFCESYCDTYGLNISVLRFANVYGPHIDCLRKQPPFVGYMIRELFYDRVPTFYAVSDNGRDYIYVDDLIDLAILISKGDYNGFEAINVSSNKSYSVKDLYKIASGIMNKDIEPIFASTEKYWDKYPDLYSGIFPIKNIILENEVNKKTLCDNGLAKTKYGWEPKVEIIDGLKKSIDYITSLLKSFKK